MVCPLQSGGSEPHGRPSPHSHPKPPSLVRRGDQLLGNRTESHCWHPGQGEELATPERSAAQVRGVPPRDKALWGKGKDPGPRRECVRPRRGTVCAVREAMYATREAVCPWDKGIGARRVAVRVKGAATMTYWKAIETATTLGKGVRSQYNAAWTR